MTWKTLTQLGTKAVPVKRRVEAAAVGPVAQVVVAGAASGLECESWKRAWLGVARGNKFPQLQEAFAEYGRVNLSSAAAIAFPVQDFDNWGTGFNMAWELDFWGRGRNGQGGWAR